MKHRQDKDFRGGGHPYNKLLSRIEWSQIVENCECSLKRLLPLPSAVTLGEILISMAIIGALVLILMPILRSVKPDENEAMHKKTTFVVERVVNELSSDDYLYPNNGEYSSLSNTDSVTYNGVTHGGLTKFCTLFASRINKKPGTEVNCTMGAVSVTSVEGVDWYLPISNFRNGSETLMVDVNGGEEPNELGEDRFEYQIQPGFKVPTIEVTHYENATERPDDKATVGNVVKPDHEDKAGLGKYNIACTGDGHATILGVGSGKVNGNYTLVAIPKPGYKCNWFTRQVTVKDADVTDCALSCSPDSVVPESDGETTPGGGGGDDDDDDDDEEPKNPVNVVVNWSGESGCNYICDKNDCMYYEGELYKVTITGDNGKHLEAVWLPGSSGSGVIMGEETVIERAECKKVETQKCYDIKPIVGNPNHCPYQLPAGNCPNEGEENKYLPNQDYGIVVSPEEGYTFNNTSDKSTYTVKLGNSDAKPDFRNLCKSSSDNEATIVIDTEEFKSSSANGAIQTVSAITSVTVTNDASVSGEMTIPKNEFHYPQKGTGYDRPTDPIKVTFSIGKPSAKYTTYHAEVTNTLTMDEKGYYGYDPVTCDLNINGTKVACDAKTATVNDVKYTIIYTGPPIVVAGPPSVDPCASSNKYRIKITETSPSNPSIAGGGPWYGTRPTTDREGNLTVNGGTPFEIYLRYPGGYDPANNPGGKFWYVKSFTVNGQEQNTANEYTYKTIVCENINANIVYDEMTDPGQVVHVWVYYYLDGKKVYEKDFQMRENQNFVYSAPSEYDGGKYSRYQIEDGQNNILESGTSPNVKYGIGSSGIVVRFYYTKEQSVGNLNVTANLLLKGKGKLAGTNNWSVKVKNNSTGKTYTFAYNWWTDKMNQVVKDSHTQSVEVGTYTVTESNAFLNPTVDGYPDPMAPSSEKLSAETFTVKAGQTTTLDYDITYEAKEIPPLKDVSITMYWKDDSGKFNNTTMGTHCGSNASGRYENPDGTLGNFTDNPANGQKATVKAGATLYLNQSTSDCDVRPTSTESTLCKPKGITIEGNSISGTYQVSGNTSVTSLTGYYHWDCSESATPQEEVHNIHLEFRYQIQSCSGPYYPGMPAPGANIHYNLVAIDKYNDSEIELPFTASLYIRSPDMGSIKVGAKGDWGRAGETFTRVTVGTWSPTNEVKVGNKIYKIVSAGEVRGTWDPSSASDCSN